MKPQFQPPHSHQIPKSLLHHLLHTTPQKHCFKNQGILALPVYVGVCFQLNGPGKIYYKPDRSWRWVHAVYISGKPWRLDLIVRAPYAAQERWMRCKPMPFHSPLESRKAHTFFLTFSLCHRLFSVFLWKQRPFNPFPDFWPCFLFGFCSYFFAWNSWPFCIPIV